MDANDAVRQHVLDVLRGGHAHATLQDAIEGFPAGSRGKKIPGLPYSAWQILEHIRIAQWDILQFSLTSEHVSPKWPEGYWPEKESPESERQWEDCIAAIRDDLVAMERLVSNPLTDLYARIPHGDGQTILREALLIADHNAYHIGQIVLIRRLL